MKKLILSLAVIICFAASCNTSTKEEKRKHGNSVEPFHTSTINVVPLDSAMVYIQAYVNFWDSISGYSDSKADTGTYMSPLRSFEISNRDLVGLLGLDTAVLSKCTFTAVRAYLGIKGQVADADFHLYLTPINANGRDTILTQTDTLAGKASVSNYVFDLTTPCPNTCDSTSPLFQAFVLQKRRK